MYAEAVKTEAVIREVLENWTRAVRARDLDGVMAHFAPDVVAFDAILQMQFKGVDAYRDHYAKCLTMFPEGEIVFELKDLQVVAGDGVAFSHCLIRCGGVDAQGKEESGWTRGTICFELRDGQWRVTHEHFSAPFDPETSRAMFDLTP